MFAHGFCCIHINTLALISLLEIYLLFVVECQDNAPETWRVRARLGYNVLINFRLNRSLSFGLAFFEFVKKQFTFFIDLFQSKSALTLQNIHVLLACYESVASVRISL